jgi:lipopolysaccharide biosynthesis protein
MKRLALYAHHGRSPQVAGYVFYCLQCIAELGFEVCLVSNSEISPDSAAALQKICARVIVRENTGMDFSMWQRGLAEYDLAQWDELLLTNSSMVGPLQPLDALWKNPNVADGDFWGLTDNDELKPHLSSYFLVFRQPVLRSDRFRAFWPTVLPYRNRSQVIFSYELGLSDWLAEGGFRWRAVFPQKEIIAASRAERLAGGPRPNPVRMLQFVGRQREQPSRNTATTYPDLLLRRGMPFLKLSLLHQPTPRCTPALAFEWLAQSTLPVAIQQELRRLYPVA